MEAPPQTLSQLLLTPFWPNFKDLFLGTSRTDSNCHCDICPVLSNTIFLSIFPKIVWTQNFLDPNYLESTLFYLIKFLGTQTNFFAQNYVSFRFSGFQFDNQSSKQSYATIKVTYFYGNHFDTKTNQWVLTLKQLNLVEDSCLRESRIVV